MLTPVRGMLGVSRDVRRCHRGGGQTQCALRTGEDAVPVVEAGPRCVCPRLLSRVCSVRCAPQSDSPRPVSAPAVHVSMGPRTHRTVCCDPGGGRSPRRVCAPDRSVHTQRALRPKPLTARPLRPFRSHTAFPFDDCSFRPRVPAGRGAPPAHGVCQSLRRRGANSRRCSAPTS